MLAAIAGSKACADVAACVVFPLQCWLVVLHDDSRLGALVEAIFDTGQEYRYFLYAKSIGDLRQFRIAVGMKWFHRYGLVNI